MVQAWWRILALQGTRGQGLLAIFRCERREVQRLGAPLRFNATDLLIQVGSGHEQDPGLSKVNSVVPYNMAMWLERSLARSRSSPACAALARSNRRTASSCGCPGRCRPRRRSRRRSTRKGCQARTSGTTSASASWRSPVAVVFNVLRPALELGVLLWIEAAVRKRRETRPVLVAGDVAHEVVCAVGLQTFEVGLDKSSQLPSSNAMAPTILS